MHYASTSKVRLRNKVRQVGKPYGDSRSSVGYHERYLESVFAEPCGEILSGTTRSIMSCCRMGIQDTSAIGKHHSVNSRFIY
jgi:hypothetical protein